ncbi:MAG TPA: hypothetical protein VHR47_12325 [Bacillota bacterium]|nr:hypothetical protein [Bacillota bacterium]
MLGVKVDGAICNGMQALTPLPWRPKFVGSFRKLRLGGKPAPGTVAIT